MGPCRRLHGAFNGIPWFARLGWLARVPTSHGFLEASVGSRAPPQAALVPEADDCAEQVGINIWGNAFEGILLLARHERQDASGCKKTRGCLYAI